MTSDGPGPHPSPPAQLSNRDLPVSDFDGSLWRIYQNQFPDALHFGKSCRYRFDSPSGSFGVCYCACQISGAFLETFGHSTEMNLVTHEALKARSLVEISLKRDLNLVELTGPNLRKVGADARLVSGQNYSLSRKWAGAIHDHPETVDGIRYPARTDPSQYSIAIFDRAQNALEITSEIRLDSSAGIQQIIPAIDRYDFGIE